MICTGFLIGAQRVVGSLQGFMGLYKVVKVSLVSIGCLKGLLLRLVWVLARLSPGVIEVLSCSEEALGV